MGFPAERSVVLAVAWWAIAVAIGLLLADEYGRVPRLVGEAPVWLALAVLVVRDRGFQALLRELGPRAALIATVPALMVVGQVVNNENRTYPFPPWAMYRETSPRNSFTEFELELVSGRRVAYPFNEVVPRFGRAFKNRFAWALSYGAGSEPPAEATGLHRRDLEHLVRLYARLHPDDRVRRIRAFEVTVPIERYAGRASVVRRESTYLEVH